MNVTNIMRGGKLWFAWVMTPTEEMIDQGHPRYLEWVEWRETYPELAYLAREIGMAMFDAYCRGKGF